MKLIDLLVQELPKRGGWPNNADGCSQCVIDGEITLHGCCKPRSGIYLDLAEDWDDVMITRDQYEAALEASKQPAWNGFGLPPDGCECEVKSGKNSWTLCKVVHSSEAGVAFIYLEEPSTESSSRYLGVLDSIPRKHADTYFRPLRTEDERKREDMIEIIFHWADQAFDLSNEMNRGVCGALYDAIAAGKIHGIKLE